MSSTETISNSYPAESDNTIDDNIQKCNRKRSATGFDPSRTLNTTYDEEGGFTEIKKKRPRKATLGNDRRILSVEGTTVIFAPIQRDAQLAKMNHLKLSEYLTSELPGRIKEIRLNPSKNIIAVEVVNPTANISLLKLTSICTIPVRANAPRPQNSPFRVLKDIDISLNDAQILKFTKSDTPVLAARLIKRGAGAVRITCLGDNPPQQITFQLVSMHVDHYQPRALQCDKCYRHGHIATCSSNRQLCANCGTNHEDEEWRTKEPICVNSGGNHPATAKECPKLRIQRSIAR
ncbi:uncharacterized protein LOC135392426 [Ornithodoros turicata]|uniref:uncharacterized protein LOC135392426 n=1 Tax=Ornithodoros turicata TaxID=34597 RepID=UPI003139E8B2